MTTPSKEAMGDHFFIPDTGNLDFDPNCQTCRKPMNYDSERGWYGCDCKPSDPSLRLGEEEGHFSLWWFLDFNWRTFKT